MFLCGKCYRKKSKKYWFSKCNCCRGNVENLKELILQNFDQKDGKLIYVSGETISVDLDQQLIKEGI